MTVLDRGTFDEPLEPLEPLEPFSSKQIISYFSSVNNIILVPNP